MDTSVAPPHFHQDLLKQMQGMQMGWLREGHERRSSTFHQDLLKQMQGMQMGWHPEGHERRASTIHQDLLEQIAGHADGIDILRDMQGPNAHLDVPTPVRRKEELADGYQALDGPRVAHPVPLSLLPATRTTVSKVFHPSWYRVSVCTMETECLPF